MNRDAVRLMGAAIHFSSPGPSRGLHYHASTHTSRLVALQRNNETHTIIYDSTRRTDIMTAQEKIESGLKEPKINQNNAMDLSRGSAVT
jgi:hypothetical protein